MITKEAPCGVLFLEEKKIFVSTKSTCSSHKNDVAKTIGAMNLPSDVAQSAIRISFSHLTTKAHIDEFISQLKIILKTVKKQRG